MVLTLSSLLSPPPLSLLAPLLFACDLPPRSVFVDPIYLEVSFTANSMTVSTTKAARSTRLVWGIIAVAIECKCRKMRQVEEHRHGGVPQKITKMTTQLDDVSSSQCRGT